MRSLSAGRLGSLQQGHGRRKLKPDLWAKRAVPSHSSPLVHVTLLFQTLRSQRRSGGLHSATVAELGENDFGFFSLSSGSYGGSRKELKEKVLGWLGFFPAKVPGRGG